MRSIANKLVIKTIEIINNVKFKEDSRMANNQFTRNRKMNFKKVIYFCLNFIKKSLQLELDDFMELFDEEAETTITKQAFSKARQKILPEAFKSLILIVLQQPLANKCVPTETHSLILKISSLPIIS